MDVDRNVPRKSIPVHQFWNDDLQQSSVQFRVRFIPIDVDGEVEGTHVVADQSLVDGQMRLQLDRSFLLLILLCAIDGGPLLAPFLSRRCWCRWLCRRRRGLEDTLSGWVIDHLRLWDLRPGDFACHEQGPRRRPAQVKLGLVLDAGQFDLDVEALRGLPHVGLGHVDILVFVVEDPVSLVREVRDGYVVQVVTLFREGVRHVSGRVRVNVWIGVEERHWHWQ